MDDTPARLPFYSHRDWNPDGTLKDGATERALARVRARCKNIAVPWTRQMVCADRPKDEDYQDPREEVDGGIDW
jgi:hypothetical protein